MSDKPILHPRTKEQVERFLARPSHGLLIEGSDGAGKYYLANWLAMQLSSSCQTIAVAEDKKLIGIEQIKALYQLTQTGRSQTIIIRDGHQMSHEAQNAFLKLLEEPPVGTKFIITSHTPQLLLATIRSRLQKIDVISPQIDLILDQNASDEDRRLLLSVGRRVGKFHTILNDTEAQQAHAAIIDEAKQFYAGSTYQRLQIMLRHNYDRDWLIQLIKALATIIESLIAAKHSQAAAKLIKQAKLIDKTYGSIAQINGNAKLHASRLALEL